jgi:hypothetical protein
MLPKDFSQFQVASLAGLGAIYWGMAAYKIRRFGPVAYANDLRRISMFLSLLPIGYVVIRFSEAILGINSKERLTTTTIMCSSALLLDGIAFMWFPTIYENPELKQKNPPAAVTVSRMGAALILGGVGILLGIALFT